MLTSHQQAVRAAQMSVAAHATKDLNELPPEVVLTVFEAHLIGRSDISASDLEKMSDKVRHVAWARERGEI